MHYADTWSERRVLGAGVLRGIITNFLLANCHLCLSSHLTSCRNASGFSDETGEDERLKGLQVCGYDHLHLKHSTCGTCIGEVWSKIIH